jgi:hypothetical protein
MHIGFFGFGHQKPNRNRSVWADFGSVSGLFFFPVWLFFMGKNRTEPKMITTNEHEREGGWNSH